MHHKKPTPLLVPVSKPPRVCPVCGTSSYSRDGIHPQCAQKQADAPRVAKIKAQVKAAEIAKASSTV